LVSGQKYSEITFLKKILSAYPAIKKDVHFLKYHIYVGRNIGRGQILPDGSKSNNNTIYNATSTGIVSKILDQPLISNPNVGGFGHGDVEIVLQDPSRVQGLLFFLAFVYSGTNIFGFEKKKNNSRRFNFLK
ncbi:hypothetical protein MKX03_001932, partial [Papaver bracteatum]